MWMRPRAPLAMISLHLPVVRAVAVLVADHRLDAGGLRAGRVMAIASALGRRRGFSKAISLAPLSTPILINGSRRSGACRSRTRPASPRRRAPPRPCRSAGSRRQGAAASRRRVSMSQMPATSKRSFAWNAAAWCLPRLPIPRHDSYVLSCTARARSTSVACPTPGPSRSRSPTSSAVSSGNIGRLTQRRRVALGVLQRADDLVRLAPRETRPAGGWRWSSASWRRCRCRCRNSSRSSRFAASFVSTTYRW